MSQYLEQTSTGRIFPHTDVLAARRDMRPYERPQNTNTQTVADTIIEAADEATEDEAAEDEAADEATEDEAAEDEAAEEDGAPPYLEVDGQRVAVKHASKKLLEDFAKAEFGINLDRRKAQDTLANEVKRMIEEAAE